MDGAAAFREVIKEVALPRREHDSGEHLIANGRRQRAPVGVSTPNLGHPLATGGRHSITKVRGSIKARKGR